jgi:hypothetical protein
LSCLWCTRSDSVGCAALAARLALPRMWRPRGGERGVPMLAPELVDTVSGFDPVSFAALLDMEERHFWFVARNELIVALADRFFPSAKCYLEIGCGNGAVLRAIAASRRWERLVGSDLHPAA